jgi:chromosome segregation ATPase
MPSAQVHAIERLTDFRAALQTFADKAKDAMSSNQMEIRRSIDWLESQLQLWKSEIRRAEELVFQAKQELTRRKMMKIGDRTPDTTAQEKELRKAQARLEHAEEKRDNTKSWLQRLPDDVEEYDGLARPFVDFLEHDVPKMILFVDQKIAALEAYQRVNPTAGDGS